ncbi:MAG: hypothetical protein QXT37_04000 [Thermofilaceae archaeon]
MPETRLAVYVTAQTVKQLVEDSLPAEKALELLRGRLGALRGFRVPRDLPHR